MGFYDYFPLGELVSRLPTIWEKVGCMCTPRCERGRVLRLLPAGEVGFHCFGEGWLHVYSPLGGGGGGGGGEFYAIKRKIEKR